MQLGDIAIKLRLGLAGDWRAKGEHLLNDLASSDRPVVVCFDELPILVNRILKGPEHEITPERRHETDVFVSWLRAQTIRHRGVIRFVVAGSIGLEPVLRQAGLSATINTFTPFELGPWDRDTAVGCWHALAENYGLAYEPGALEQMFELLGVGIPHHVQLFFDQLYRDSRRRESDRCSIEDVRRVYETSILSTRGHAELSHYEERLRMMVGRDALPVALTLLTETAVTGALTLSAAQAICADHVPAADDRAQVLRELLEIFEHDGYLVRDGELYRFHSRLLAEWWKARFGFGYVPVGDK